ncbi:MAG: transglycosylase SLT domain-containing protein, partial [Flavobacteriales bacterium]
LIRAVSKGEIDYTVADHNVALLNQSYYPNLDIETELSLKQEIGWAVRQTSTELMDSLNSWLEEFKHTKRFAMIHLKYFKARSKHRDKVLSEYSSVSGKRISQYDEIIKKESERLGWDWRLLAALIYHESHFNAEAQSWSGATGLMQLIPETAERYGVDSLTHPDENVHAGVSFLLKLQDYWIKQGLQSTQLYCFTLASYNVGLGHVLDACRLAEKHGRSRKDWYQVAEFLELKCEPEFYNDSVVKHGYCRGTEPVAYVDDVISTWNHYRNVAL